MAELPSVPSAEKKRKREAATDNKPKDIVTGWRLANLVERTETLHFSKIALDVKQEHGQVCYPLCTLPVVLCILL